MSSMKLHVDTKLAHRLFDEKFGGIENFGKEEIDFTETVVKTTRPSQPSATKIYRWLKDGLPSSRNTVFGFFGTLDVDPVAMIDLDKSELQRIFGRLRHAFMMGGFNAGGFGVLFDIYKPSPDWPDNSLAQQYYARDWIIFDFDHPAEDFKNSHVTLTLRGDDSVSAGWPRAYHIAYRRYQNADGLWRPYGVVFSRFNEVVLAHENGHIQTIELPYQSEHNVKFKTYFGGGPAEFRICSLHPFSGTLEHYDDPNVPLYFPA